MQHAGAESSQPVDPRRELLAGWLQGDLGCRVRSLAIASADASFRRYFRVIDHDGASRIVMDAPPEHEDIEPYLRIGKLLGHAGVHVPAVLASDLGRGFLLLEDFGDRQYLAALRQGADPHRLYDDALRALLAIQVDAQPATAELARYDAAALEREMQLMPQWFLQRHLDLDVTTDTAGMLRAAFDFLIGELLAQPVVFVHRDYHTRNLMLLAERNPGVLDFQDALAGPIGYDPVSLLKDCYIEWPRATWLEWLARYHTALSGCGAEAGDFPEFTRWVELAGVQRHLKVLGIFARLWHRDGKAGYLRDLPLTLRYTIDGCRRFPELGVLADYLEQLADELPVATERALATVAQ
ncbi:MAG: phosphotransferase [Steroidobacteraceae bacterium]